MLVPRAALRRSFAACAVAIGALALGAASTVAAARPAPNVLRVRVLGVHDGQIGVLVWTTHGTEHDVRLTARRGSQVLATGRLATASPRRRTVELTVRRGVSTRGRFTVSASGEAPRGQTTSKTSS